MRTVRRLPLLLLLALCCGQVSPAQAGAATPRVIGGVRASAPPFLGMFIGRAGDHLQFCGGAAVAPHVFMTAAHCVADGHSRGWLAPTDMFVVFGEDDPWSALRNPLLPLWGAVRLVAPRMDTVAGIIRNDVALLQLTAPAPAVVRRASLGRTALAQPGRVATVMGWGRVKADESGSEPLLRRATMRVQRHQVCSSRFVHFAGAQELCVYSGSSTACMGDSGGPLLTSYEGRRYVIGVVKAGDVHCGTDKPSIYTNVTTGPLARFVDKWVPRLESSAAAQAAQPVPVPEVPPVPDLPRLP